MGCRNCGGPVCPTCGSSELQNNSSKEGFFLCLICGTRYNEAGDTEHWSDPL